MKEQNYKNHVRYHPVFHGVGLPLVLINFLGSIALVITRFSWLTVVMAISAAGLVVVFRSLREFSTKLQDRIIRTEENFRHYLLTGAPLDDQLTNSQIIALRFASDAEFPALCKRAVAEQLKMDQIKRAIQSWRADWHRV